jgi:hypothetical protein
MVVAEPVSTVGSAAALPFAAAGSMVEARCTAVAVSTVVVSTGAAVPTEGATGNRFNMPRSHFDGWQPRLPAVFFVINAAIARTT